jgi:hypothetical protein
MRVIGANRIIVIVVFVIIRINTAIRLHNSVSF